MTRIIDAYPLFQEYELAAIREEELRGLATPACVVANRTHAGAVHNVDMERLAFVPLLGEVDLSDDDGIASIAATRRREMTQRNALRELLRNATPALDPDDLVMISDVDEIPRRQAVEAAASFFATQNPPDGTILIIQMDLFYYDITTKAAGAIWNGTRIARWRDVDALTPHIVRYGIGLPDAHYPIYAVVANGGWHCSYFGGGDAVRTKMTNFLHQELITTENTDPAVIAARIAAREDAYGRPEQRFEPVDGSDRPVAMTPQRYPQFFRTEE